MKATAERQAVNTVIQGSASDMMKSGMLRLQCAIEQERAFASRRHSNRGGARGGELGSASGRARERWLCSRWT